MPPGRLPCRVWARLQARHGCRTPRRTQQICALLPGRRPLGGRRLSCRRVRRRAVQSGRGAGGAPNPIPSPDGAPSLPCSPEALRASAPAAAASASRSPARRSMWKACASALVACSAPSRTTRPCLRTRRRFQGTGRRRPRGLHQRPCVFCPAACGSVSAAAACGRALARAHTPQQARPGRERAAGHARHRQAQPRSL